MSILFIFGAVGLLLMLLFWAVLSPRRDDAACAPEVSEEPARQHATYFGVIRQAMSQEDLQFLAARAPGVSVRRAHKERQRIAKLYLADLRADFERLLHLASVIAVLSPAVATSHEFERLRLSVRFAWRYRLVLMGLNAGLLFLPQLGRLSLMVSDLAFHMESAMKELGERAAVAAELASALNRGRLDMA
jgi:hypothetical protein